MARRRFRIALLLAVPLSFGLASAARHWLRSHGLSLGDVANDLQRGDEPRFTWRSIDKKHWQIVGSALDAGGDPVGAGPSPGCPEGMAHVKGAFRREGNGTTTGEIERLQDTACTDWISRDFPARCRTFDKEKIATELDRLPTTSLDFCIDRFEYPNVAGAYPIIVTTFHEAEAMCKKAQKRLCNENEWTFACEGEEGRPYPYGFTRDETACVIDRTWRPFTEGALQPRDGNQAREELDRLWQGEASGTRPGCQSPFGVYDLTGNVDEWTRSVNSTGYASVLKGGYWGPVRARCRPSTRAHNEDFVAYQQGFRCCADASAEALRDAGAQVPALPAAPVAPTDAGLPLGAPTTRLGSELLPEWPEQEDENEAIRKDRLAICSTALPGAPAMGWSGRSHETWTLAVALVITSWARRRRRTAGYSSCSRDRGPVT